jgi:hypothetical protein
MKLLALQLRKQFKEPFQFFDVVREELLPGVLVVITPGGVASSKGSVNCEWLELS